MGSKQHVAIPSTTITWIARIVSTTLAAHPEGGDSPTQVIMLNRVAPAEVSPPARRDLVWRILPWVVPAVVAIVVLHRSGTPDRQTALYAAYFAAAVMLPGTLVMRGLFGSRGGRGPGPGVGRGDGGATDGLGAGRRDRT